MKNIVYTLALVLFLSDFSYAQWASLGSQWCFNIPQGSTEPFYNYDLYEFVEDTSINGKLCQKISNGLNTEVFLLENNMVYYLYDTVFRKLYDFNVQEGQTLELTYKALITQNGIYKDTVLNVNVFIDSIKTISVSSQNLKKFYGFVMPNSLYPELVWPKISYLEKIGSESSIIEYLKPSNFDLWSGLRCFKDSNLSYETAFWLLQNKACDYNKVVGLPNMNKEQYHFYYDEKSDEYVLESKNKKLRFFIYSLDGKVLVNNYLCEEALFKWKKPVSTSLYLIKTFDDGQFNAFLF